MTFDDKYRIRAHAVITNEAGEVLQLRQTYEDKRWGLPGGALDPGETIHDAVVRECLEELGVPVEIEYLSGVYYHAAFHAHVCIFRCDMASDAEIRLSTEHSEYRYFGLDELSPVQRRRVDDCLCFDGRVKSDTF